MLEKRFPGLGQVPQGAENSFLRGRQMGQGLENCFPEPGETPHGPENSFPKRGESPLTSENSFPDPPDIPLGAENYWLWNGEVDAVLEKRPFRGQDAVFVVIRTLAHTFFAFTPSSVSKQSRRLPQIQGGQQIVSDTGAKRVRQTFLSALGEHALQGRSCRQECLHHTPALHALASSQEPNLWASLNLWENQDRATFRLRFRAGAICAETRRLDLS